MENYIFDIYFKTGNRGVITSASDAEGVGSIGVIAQFMVLIVLAVALL